MGNGSKTQVCCIFKNSCINEDVELYFEYCSLAAELSLNTREKQSKVIVEMEDVKKNETSQQMVYIRAHKIGDRTIVVKVIYLGQDLYNTFF